MRPERIEQLLERAPALAACEGSVVRAFEIMRDAYRAGNKLLLCGNGGSAADADHWAGELLKAFGRPRPLPEALRARLPGDLGSRLQAPLAAIPLTGFNALSTAWANDVDGTLGFAQLVLGLGRPGDVLVAISTSGNSKSVCAAAETANALGLSVVGLTGAGGGRLAGLCAEAIRVPSDETYRIQEYHLPIYHCLSLMLEDAFFA
jgi:D-sedoheptulose 7-phosphate isomerase